MDTFKKIVLLALIGTVFVTCKKEELPQSAVAGQPVFTFSGIMGANPLNVQAGVNNYYMYSSDTVANGVYSFRGTLQSTATSKNSIQIIINDDIVVAQGSPSDISKSVIPAYYYYSIPGGNPVNYAVTFKPIIYSGIPRTYTYQFGDGNSISVSDTSRSVTHTYKKLQPYVVTTLAVQFTNQTETLSNPINLMKQPTPLSIDSIHCSLDTDSGLSKTESLTAFFTGGAPTYTYVWYFGDGKADSATGTTTGTAVSITHSYTISARSDPPDTLVFGVKDANNTIVIHRILIQDTANDPSINRMNYYISPPSPVPNPSYLSNVTVNYTDGNGVAYTSNNVLQPYVSTFQVLSVSNYQNNLNNNPTKMLKITFNCMLYPINGGLPIPASNCIAIIAVAYQ